MTYAQAIKEKIEMLPVLYQVRLCAVLDDMAKVTKTATGGTLKHRLPLHGQGKMDYRIERIKEIPFPLSPPSAPSYLILTAARG